MIGLVSVQNNLLAMNANRMMGLNKSTKTKSTEKLSSGYRINRSADDAAGLAISEKMRRQIRGLTQASANCQDGISFCQVADGAINEISDILLRMKELSVHAANGTLSDEDRSAIQDECDELIMEIDRITTTTEFNEVNVFGKKKSKEISELSDGSIDITKNLKEVLGSSNVSQGNMIDSSLTLTVRDWTWRDGYKAETGWQCTGDYLYKENESGNTISLNDIVNLVNTFDIPREITVEDVLNHYFGSYSGGWSLLLTDQDPENASNESNRMYFGWTNNVTSRTDPSKYGIGNMDGNAVPMDMVLRVGTWVESKDTYFKEMVINKAYAIDPDLPGATGYLYRDYGSSWLDFSGLGEDYTVEDLDGKGISFRAGGTDKYYSVVLRKDACTDTTPNGNTYSVADDKSVINVGIGNCINGEDIAKAIYDVINESGFLNESNVQSAYNRYDSSKIYFFDNRVSQADGVDSEFIFSPMADAGNRYAYKGDIWIQAGGEAGNGFYIKRPALDIYELGIDNFNVRNEMLAEKAIDRVDKAISITNRERSIVGAQQNKCKHAYRVDDNITENTTSAESRIRDTDMAKEMVNYSMINILSQSGQSVLAQANQSNQGILSLLS